MKVVICRTCALRFECGECNNNLIYHSCEKWQPDDLEIRRFNKENAGWRKILQDETLFPPEDEQGSVQSMMRAKYPNSKIPDFTVLDDFEDEEKPRRP